MPSLIIDRGIPGAGKSTLARELVMTARRAGLQAVTFSEDEFWTDRDGSYNYDPTTTKEAFEAMYANVREAMRREVDLIVMATAALSLEEPGLQAVVHAAKSLGYRVFPILLQRDTGYPPSVHDVSEAEMERFRREMSHGLECSFSNLETFNN